MSLNNYTELQAAVASWLTRTDQTANIPDFIRLYEADANRRIRIRANQSTEQVTLSQGNALAVLPSDFLEEVELNYDDTSIALTKMSFDDLDRLTRRILLLVALPSTPSQTAVRRIMRSLRLKRTRTTR